MFSAAIKSGAVPAVAPADPYFYDVPLLLSGDGTNGAQNNTFLDSSTNNFSITRNGNTTQGSFSPYGSLWSVDFQSSNYQDLQVASSADFNFGSGDFTIECFFNSRIPASGGTFYRLFDTGQLTIFFYGGNIYFRNGSDSDLVSPVSHGMSINNWYHLAFVRSGSTYYIFRNGSQITSGTGGSISNSNAVFTIGTNTGYNQPLDGMVSNVRVNKGQALYTTTFTPATEPLTTTSQSSTAANVKLLTCQSNRFVDNSSANQKTILFGDNGANLGSRTVQRFSPFNPTSAYSTSTVGGSGYFDGSSDYLTAGSQTAYNFGTGDFTIEFWAYVTKSMTTSTVTTAIGYGTSLASNGWAIDSGLSNGCFTWSWLTSPYTSVTTGVLPQNSWCHVAIVRSGTTLTAYLNGAVSESKTFSSTVTPTNSPTLTIGQHSSVIAGREYQGYLTNVRLLNGVAAYTGAFTPPTAPLATSGAASAASYPSTTNVNTSFSSSACALLLGTTNAGIYDSAMMNDLETVGGAQISTAQKKYGTASMYFDGNGDWLTAPDNVRNLFKFGTGDFTIEFWAWKSANGVNGYDGVIGSDNNGNAPGGFALELSSNRGFVFYNDSNVRISYAMNPNDSTWHHYACVRSSGTMALYKDGTQLTTATYTGDLGCNNLVRVGTLGTTSNFNGYIDDLRVTRGYARYTSSFTPPTAALPNY